MDRLLDELPELEHRLLLYAAGELSAEQVEMVERELADNPAAREALEGLGGLLSDTTAGLAALEAAERVPRRAVRRASDRAIRAVFGWVEAETESRLLGSRDRGSLSEGVVWRYARWPLAAAAVLVVGLMVWTFGTEPTGTTGGGIAQGGLRGPTEVAQPVTTGQPPVTQVATGSPLEQVAAIFDNPAGRWDRDGDSELLPLELGSALSEELVALRLLYEPDWE